MLIISFILIKKMAINDELVKENARQLSALSKQD